MNGWNRRAFIQGGALVLGGLSFPAGSRAAVPNEPAPLRIGLVTDLHHADKPPQGSRYYQETIDKFQEARRAFADEQVALAFELGDLIDAADTVEQELEYLQTIQQELATLSCPWHYVLGNHCVYALTKQEFLDRTSRRPSYYAFDHGGVHFVVLDACFRHDGQPYGRYNSQWDDANVPDAELKWLQRDLARNDLPAIVFTHQRLDRDPPDPYAVRQSPSVRAVLQQAGRVVAVFQGHSHKNDYRQIDGIHYCTLRAMIEGSGTEHSGYAVLDVWPDGTLRIRGRRQQHDYLWPAPESSRAPTG